MYAVFGKHVVSGATHFHAIYSVAGLTVIGSSIIEEFYFTTTGLYLPRA